MAGDATFDAVVSRDYEDALAVATEVARQGCGDQVLWVLNDGTGCFCEWSEARVAMALTECEYWGMWPQVFKVEGGSGRVVQVNRFGNVAEAGVEQESM